jgi:hypothetical protein
MTMVISGSDGVTFPDSTNQFSGGAFSFKNRIINGDMRIDQRNAGASVNTGVGNNYNPDRWLIFDSAGSKMSVQQVTDAPAGFAKSQKITSLAATSPASTDYYFDCQRIEGFNVADFGWGTANAKTLTLSFWVNSSLTGTFSGAFGNASFNRSYVFTYSVSAANTWEQKTVTVTGDTTGTWATDNSTGLQVVFDLGSGSSRAGTAGSWSANDYRKATGSVSVIGTLNATWYITGVQLEVGSVATPFERRPFGTELALCQRYFEKSFPIGTAPADNINTTAANTTQFLTTSYSGAFYVSQNFNFQVSKRAGPTMTFYAARGVVGTDGAAGQWRSFIGGVWVNHSSTASNQATNTGFIAAGDYSSGGTTGQAYFATGEWTASAEL